VEEGLGGGQPIQIVFEVAVVLHPRLVDLVDKVSKTRDRRVYVVRRANPAKNHSAKALSESVVNLSSSPMFPRLAAIWKRRKSFTVAMSRASTPSRRQRRLAPATPGIGSPCWIGLFAISESTHLLFGHVSTGLCLRARRSLTGHSGPALNLDPSWSRPHASACLVCSPLPMTPSL
jgi:hypothetical protein